MSWNVGTLNADPADARNSHRFRTDTPGKQRGAFAFESCHPIIASHQPPVVNVVLDLESSIGGHMRAVGPGVGVTAGADAGPFDLLTAVVTAKQQSQLVAHSKRVLPPDRVGFGARRKESAIAVVIGAIAKPQFSVPVGVELRPRKQ